MSSRFVRKVRTASGAVAVQLVSKQAGRVVGVEHVGSAHTDAELGLLLQVAEQRLHSGQDTLDLGPVQQMPAQMDQVPDWTSRARQPLVGLPKPSGRPELVAGGGRVVATGSLVLWQVLAGGYDRLGFGVLADEAFKQMVLARIVEPTSKADCLRVLSEIGVAAPGLNTIYRSLKRCQDRDYRNVLCRAAVGHSAITRGLAGLVMYDVTTLHFEVDEDDDLRKVGMSKEHRVDPQVQVGLLVDPSGFPLEVHLFAGNKAETGSLIPVLTQFQTRHGVTGMVVVADAGMLSAGNLNAIEDAGFNFIVGSRITKAPYDLADHFERCGDWFADGQVLESSRTMGTGAGSRSRRVVYQYSSARRRRDDRAINAQIARAERIAAGKAPVSRARFLKISGADKHLDQATIDRARQLAGLKGYVTNLPVEQMPAQQLISHYHDLWQVEASFRMTKSDLKARPVFHHRRDAIEAHITVVFAALAVARHLQTLTGVSIKKLVHTLRTGRSATIDINGHQLTVPPAIPPAAQQLLDRIPHTGN